jgi:2'-5' RNA ligase
VTKPFQLHRLFVAVEIPSEIRNNLLSQAQSQVEIPTLRWSRPEYLHLTLAFLGDADPKAVLKSLNEARFDASPFELTLSRWGAFPSANSARVLWAGATCSNGDEPLHGLASQVAEACQPVAPHMDASRFTPHITLARTTRSVNLRPIALEISPATFHVNGFSLFDSLADPAQRKLGTFEL